MAVWGATAGVATLVGPILGGFLVDAAGWPWVVNVPVGIIAFVPASRLVPRVETHAHAFDWLGVALSAVGCSSSSSASQEGHQHDWNAVIGR